MRRSTVIHDVSTRDQGCRAPGRAGRGGRGASRCCHLLLDCFGLDARLGKWRLNGAASSIQDKYTMPERVLWSLANAGRAVEATICYYWPPSIKLRKHRRSFRSKCPAWLLQWYGCQIHAGAACGGIISESPSAQLIVRCGSGSRTARSLHAGVGSDMQRSDRILPWLGLRRITSEATFASRGSGQSDPSHSSRLFFCVPRKWCHSEGISNPQRNTKEAIQECDARGFLTRGLKCQLLMTHWGTGAHGFFVFSMAAPMEH